MFTSLLPKKTILIRKDFLLKIRRRRRNSRNAEIKLHFWDKTTKQNNNKNKIVEHFVLLFSIFLFGEIFREKKANKKINFPKKFLQWIMAAPHTAASTSIQTSHPIGKNGQKKNIPTILLHWSNSPPPRFVFVRWRILNENCWKIINFLLFWIKTDFFIYSI